jgi:hypothetical protein
MTISDPVSEASCQKIPNQFYRRWIEGILTRLSPDSIGSKKCLCQHMLWWLNSLVSNQLMRRLAGLMALIEI